MLGEVLHWECGTYEERVVDEYAGVLKTAPISTFPVNSPRRWSILVDSLVVGNKQIAVSSNVTGAPSNKAVRLIDLLLVPSLVSICDS